MFKPSFESLHTYTAPDWFRDAKFGIWSHWGPQSVPMYGDWYARNMYIEGSEQYRYHIRTYGHPSKFGYKDVADLWKAEKFDPEGLMALFVEAGAQYFVCQGMHHDHFFNYPSKLNRFNAMEWGPKKDIVGLWQAAAKKYDLPFGMTEHLGASYWWWGVNKGADQEGPYKGVPYDGNDPEYLDIYHDNAEMRGVEWEWYTKNEAFRKYWEDCMVEMIDLYQPDLLYTDGALPFGDREVSKLGDQDFEQGLNVVAHLYNTSIQKYGENRAVYTQKDTRPEIYQVGVLDVEKSQLETAAAEPWQTDSCIGNWFYDVRQVYKTPGHIIEMLIDIVAKNGVLLLNVLQKPDGTIDDEAKYILEELASWMKVGGEGIFASRPWRRHSEGSSAVRINGFEESRVAWTDKDLRFTMKDKVIYAYMMATPIDRKVVIKSLEPSEKVQEIRLLGGEALSFTQVNGLLVVELPDQMPTKYTNGLAIQLS